MAYNEPTTGAGAFQSPRDVPQREPQLACALSRLSRALDRTEKTLSIHVDRIQSVLRPPSPLPNPPNVKESPEVDLCDLARALTDRARHLEGLCDKLDEVTARIEL